MTTKTRSCPLDVSEQTLSALRDGLLGRDERAHLKAHVASCAACQRRLDAFEQVGWTLRGQHEPDLRAEVWRGLQARISQQDSSRGQPTVTRLALRPGPAAIAAVAAVLVVALFVVALTGHLRPSPGGGTTGVRPTATIPATLSATSTPTTSPTGIAAGWTAAAIPAGYLPTVAVAPSNPRIAYAVVITAGGAASVQVSLDGGSTWKSVASPTANQDRCSISVDPTDAQDVVLICTPAASSGYTVLRSFDGAKSWSKPQLGVTVNCYGNQGWAGSTLLLAFSLCDAQSSQTQLTASVAKGPFKRLDSNGSLSGITLQQSILNLTGHGSTFVVEMGQISYNPTQLDDTLVVSEDAGATWKAVTLSDGGQRVHLYAADPTGREWVGVYENAPTQLALSSDDGQTWHKYPAPWANEMGPGAVLVALDGTVVVTDERAHFEPIPDTVYRAAPGATGWNSSLVMPANAFMRAIAWDPSGHPTALWAQMASDSRGSAWYLVSHPL